MVKKCNVTNIDVVGDTINIEHCVRYLGAWLDESLNFEHHVMKKCATAMSNFRKIRTIRSCLTQEATETLVLNLCISQLDYSNGMLMGCPAVLINRLQRIQNVCAKLVLNLKRQKFDSAKDALHTLHWLPVSKRIDFKIACQVFKCLNGNGPAYLLDLLCEAPERARNTRSSSNYYKELCVPFHKNKTFADRAFSTYAPRLWNNLPNSVKNVETISQFKKGLKTYLFTL